VILSHALPCSCKSKEKEKEKKRNINNDLAVLPSHDTLSFHSKIQINSNKFRRNSNKLG